MVSQSRLEELRRQVESQRRKVHSCRRSLEEAKTAARRADRSLAEAKTESTRKSRAHTASSAADKVRQKERELSNAEGELSKRESKLSGAEGDQSKQQSREHDAAIKRLDAARRRYETERTATPRQILGDGIESQIEVPALQTVAPEWDAFISHANEDKEAFVSALASELESAGLKVWYDNATLTMGDSLREKIDEG